MNFFYNWCSRIAAKHHKKLEKQIEDAKEQLYQARRHDKIVSEGIHTAAVVTNNLYQVNNKDIATMIRYIEMTSRGQLVEWREVIEKQEQWFVDRGLEIPRINDGENK